MKKLAIRLKSWLGFDMKIACFGPRTILHQFKIILHSQCWGTIWHNQWTTWHQAICNRGQFAPRQLDTKMKNCVKLSFNAKPWFFSLCRALYQTLVALSEERRQKGTDASILSDTIWKLVKIAQVKWSFTLNNIYVVKMWCHFPQFENTISASDPHVAVVFLFLSPAPCLLNS